MQSITVSCPAKLNLYLRVTGRDSKGYHLLHTVFHRISLCDTLTIRKTARPGFRLTCNKKHLPVDERNIVTRAYQMLLEKFPGLGGVSVRLVKGIPDQAGLGGGSSDAASFLLAMKKLFRLRLSRPQMLAMGKRLGADVPFFLYEVNQAVAAGRGDQIRPRPCRARHTFLLVFANKGLSTKDVFEYRARRGAADFLTKKGAAVRLLCTFLDQKKHSGLASSLFNDLEEPAFSLRPSIRRQIQLLNGAGYECVRMSGSGPTIFIVLPEDKKVQKYLKEVQALIPSAHIKVAHTY